MPVLISKTFETITHESAENGEAEENGFEWQDVPYTFRELVREMRDYSEASDSRPDERTWLTQYDEMGDLRTGDRTNYSLHFSHANKPHAARYWTLALKAAGFWARK